MKQVMMEMKDYNEFEILTQLYQKGLDSNKECFGGRWCVSRVFEGPALNNLLDAGAVEYNDTQTKIALTEFGMGMILSGAVELVVSGKQIKAKCGSMLNLALEFIINQDPQKFMSYL